MRVAILGASAAGIAAAESFRAHDTTSEVKLFARDARGPWSLPNLYRWLTGDLDDRGLAYRREGALRRLGIETAFGTTVVELDPAARAIELDGGGRERFDRILIATGAAPKVPPIPGLAEAPWATFNGLADAARIRSLLGRARRVAVLGAGFTGCEAAEALARLGLETHLIEGLDALLPAILDPPMSALHEDAFRRAGIRLHLSRRVESIDRGAGGAVVRAGGRDIPADLVVVCLGVTPNLAFLAGDAGLERSSRPPHALRVDDRLETSVPGIHAAGDCIESRDILRGEDRYMPLWTLAHRQGKAAGANMAGADVRYPGMYPMNAVELTGIPLIAYGTTRVPDDPATEVLERIDRPGGWARRIILREDRIVGALFLGRIDGAGLYRGLIDARVDVGPIKDRLLDPALSPADLPRDYVAARWSSRPAPTWR